MKKLAARSYVTLCLLFLYTPVVVMIAMAFNESRYSELPVQWSFVWFEKLLVNTRLLGAVRSSLALAGITALICVVLAVALMLGAMRMRGRAKAAVQSLVTLPLTIPWIILGLSLLLMMRLVGLERNMFFVLAGHTVVSLPYAALVIGARLSGMDASLFEASASLGANGFTTFWRVILPGLLPALLAGGFLAFLISFDNFVISYFLIPAGQSTLPMQIYSAIKFGFTPEINAVSALLILVTAGVTLLVAVFARSSLRTIFQSGEAK